MSCEHIPKREEYSTLTLEDQKKKKFCECLELAEYFCITCKQSFCEQCRDQHEHPISVTTAHAWCSICKKEIDVEHVKPFWESLPPFLPRNEKGIGLFMKYKTPKKIIILAGAGISTAAGIPDFRTPGTGLYDNLEKFNLPTPESIFTLDYFDKNPQPFFTLATELMPGLGKYFPTITHYFTSFLAEKGMVKMYFTQNIDGLEIQAGIPMDKLVLAHGHYYTGHCRKCKKEYQQADFFEDIQKGQICYCECGGVIKPDIVFFGEQLPQRFHDSLELLKDCDLLITMGTSLAVYPFASLVDFTERTVPRLFLNLTDVGGFQRYSDCKVLQKTDDACMAIADYWGLGNEFREFLDKKKLEVESGEAKPINPFK